MPTEELTLVLWVHRLTGLPQGQEARSFAARNNHPWRIDNPSVSLFHTCFYDQTLNLESVYDAYFGLTYLSVLVLRHIFQAHFIFFRKFWNIDETHCIDPKS